MITRKYKTIQGLLRQTESQSMTVQDFLECKFYHKSKGNIYFDLDGQETVKVVNKIAEYMVSSQNRRFDMVYAMLNSIGDFSLFQSFYITLQKNGGYYISNSLSGEAFRYCIRKYLKEYC